MKAVKSALNDALVGAKRMFTSSAEPLRHRLPILDPSTNPGFPIPDTFQRRISKTVFSLQYSSSLLTTYQHTSNLSPTET
jgi:hypothetical protein